MKVQKPLFWNAGELLHPQHFQLSDQYSGSLLAPYHKFLEPHFWGAAFINIQKEQLGTRTFNLASGTFLFADGTFVSLPENALIDVRPFDEAWVKGGRPLTVYVGLKKWNEQGANVTVVSSFENIGQVDTRFVATNDFEEIADLHAGGTENSIKRLHFVLKIFWETELDKLRGYELIAIAQLERVGSDIRLSEDFIPPCVTYKASASLYKLMNEIRDQVTARGYQLEEHKSRRGVQTAEFGSRDMVYFLALRSINRYVPALFHLTATDVHPWHLYGLLRQLIGELTSFSERINVLGELEGSKKMLPDYDHVNLWQCFSAAQDMVSHLLDEITAGPEYIVRLIHDGAYYSAELKPAIFEGRNRFYLAVKTEEDPKTVLQALEDIAKLSSTEDLQTLVSRALPGISLQHLQVPPQELPRRSNTMYFSIDHHDDQWATVAKNRNLSLFWDGAPADLEIELMVVGR